MPMYLIGLTGGIASGKTTVAGILKALGVDVVDADQLAREAVIPGEKAYREIVSAFGTEILQPDGTINRPLLGARVFSDSALRRSLEQIVHPAIRRKAEAKLALIKESGAAVAVYMAPLLIETGIADRVDETWVVYVDPETQLTRLMMRDGLDRASALQRTAAQMPMDEKKNFARVLIDNRGTLAATEAEVRKAWNDVLGRIKQREE